jgi:hypothetical protein
MAYSPQRLAQARQLFSKTTSNFYLLSHLDDPYHTRERAAKRSAFSAAWQDSDEDDNFAFFNVAITDQAQAISFL